MFGNAEVPRTQQYGGIMETIPDKIVMAYHYLLFHPKSTATLVVFLVIVVIIAFFVNRKRDAAGQVSFIDKTRSGVIGVRVYEIEEGQRKKNWLFPLWIPQKDLLLNVRIMLPKGEYEIKAYWRENISEYVKTGLFKPRPIEKEKAYSLSDFGRFTIPAKTSIGFNLTASGKTLQIDSSDSSGLEPDSDKKPFPLVISDPSFKKLVRKFEKAKGDKIWELSITDDRILTALENQIKGLRRKLDQEAVKNKELKSDLDQVMRKLKSYQDPRKGEEK